MLSPEQSKFLQEAIDAAKAVRDTLGIIVSGQVAQSVLESGWGKKQPKFNCFGIKMHNCDYVAGVQIFLSHEKGPKPIEEKFAAYNSLQDCFFCHAWILKRNFPHAFAAEDISSYAQFLVLDPTTKLSYAPFNKQYATEIITIANAHNLVELDRPPNSETKDAQT